VLLKKLTPNGYSKHRGIQKLQQQLSQMEARKSDLNFYGTLPYFFLFTLCITKSSASFHTKFIFSNLHSNNGAHFGIGIPFRHSSGNYPRRCPEVCLTHVQTDQSAIYDVRGGTRAVIFDRLSGVKKDVVEEGTHFLVPWLQKAVIFDVRTKPRNISTTTGSKDLQMVSLTLRVLHRPNVVQLPRIYQVYYSDIELTV
jgi:SPFH domain / Band 7 family